VHERFLVASLGAVQVGFDVSHVTEVLPLNAVARVPWAPCWVSGVMNHQGRVLTLIDLGRFLELADTPAPTVAILIDRADVNLALCVAEVAIVEARDAVRIGQIKQFLPQAALITEALSTPGLEFQHLDIERVLDGIEGAF